MGHFWPYRTHTLKAKSDEVSLSRRTAIELESPITHKEVLEAGNCWLYDETSRTISFQNFDFKRTERSAGRNPYLVVQVDDVLIEDDGVADHHNDYGTVILRRL